MAAKRVCIRKEKPKPLCIWPTLLSRLLISHYCDGSLFVFYPPGMVLMEQDNQQCSGEYDPDRFARLSCHCTKWVAERAHQIAVHQSEHQHYV